MRYSNLHMIKAFEIFAFNTSRVVLNRLHIYCVAVASSLLGFGMLRPLILLLPGRTPMEHAANDLDPRQIG